MIAEKFPGHSELHPHRSVVDACAEQSELKTTVTSRAFLEKIKVKPAGKRGGWEDLAKIPRLRKSPPPMCALCFPVGVLDRLLVKSAAKTKWMTCHDYFFQRFHRRSQGVLADALQ